ncbi:MAG: AAA family ATPase [Mariprofundus sp.]
MTLSEHADLPTLVQAFFRADCYPHPCSDIRMIQTHISWVFLAGNYAYKLKKPVDFGFLNFSTLAARKHFCEQELLLNRRLSPEIYLTVLPVYQHGSRFSLNPSDTIVDYCLKMIRFSQADLLEMRLQAGTFDARWLDILATDIARFHHDQQSITSNQMDHSRLLADHIRTNLDVAATHIPAALDYPTWLQMDSYAGAALAELMPQIQQRQENGYVRRCHGDLHLRNITLLDGAPRVFDCIEFNDEFASIDTMSDVAFLVMDCDAHEHSELGMRFLSRYLEHTADYAGLALLKLFLFYRAGVRGKVACLLADELDDGDKKSAALTEAHHYFTLADRYCKPSSPRLFAISGLSGSGKSYLALQGCGVEHAVIIRSDATRKRLAGDYPELELYSMAMTRHTYAAMLEAGREALAAGWSVILDAAFLRAQERAQVSKLAHACKTPMSFYWLNIKPETLRTRITRRQQQGTDISDADVAVLELQLANCQYPDEPWVEYLTSSDIWPGHD